MLSAISQIASKLLMSEKEVGTPSSGEDVPIRPQVRSACAMLGLEPLYLACEGRLVVFAPKSEAPAILDALRKGPYSANAAIIGEVVADHPGKVVMTTEIGAQSLLPQPGGELLPRIC